MKPLLAILFLLTQVSQAEFGRPCDPRDVGYQAYRLSREASDLANAVGYQFHLQRVKRAADRLAFDSDALSREADNGYACPQLRRTFDSGVAFSFRELERELRTACAHQPNPNLEREFQQLTREFRMLERTLTPHIPPQPPHPPFPPQPPHPPIPPQPPLPPFDPCAGLGGSYAGRCAIDNKPWESSPISFVVTRQGNQCVATQSPYFQPATLAIGQGYGQAGVVGIPGGVAIANTQLTVYGNGNFLMKGYNYAGKFYFTCNR